MIKVDTDETECCNAIDCTEPIFDSLFLTIITDEGKKVEDNAMLCLFHYKEIIKQVGSGE